MESIVFTTTVEEQVKARCLGRAVLREKQRAEDCTCRELCISGRHVFGAGAKDPRA